MIYIYNRDEEQVASLDVIPEFTQEIGKLNTLTFDSDIEFDKGFRVVFIKNKKAYEFIIVDSDYVRNDIYSFSYFCQDALLEIDGNPIIDKRPEGNFKQALEVALEGTRFEIVVMPDYDMGIIYKNHFYRESSFKAFAEVIEKYMLEWWTEYEYSGSKIIKRKLIIGKRGRRVNGRLEFEKNIIEFNRKIISENVVTALFGFGKGVEVVDEDGEPTGGYGRRLDFSNINNGKMYVENLQAKEIYGIGEKGNKQHVYGFVIFEDVEDINLLLELTKKQLEVSSQPQAEYTVNASNVGVGCDIGDEIATVDNKINYRNYSRILKVIEVGEERTFTFGTRQEGYINESIKTIQGIKKEVDNRIVSVMEYTLKQITDSYFGEDGYNYDLRIGNEYGLPAGLYSFDKPLGETPSKAIYIGAGKMLISNEKDANGEWIWKTAATADGIVGSSIIAHSITANQLASDIGQSLDLSSNTSITLTVKDNVDQYFKENPPVKIDIIDGYFYVNGENSGVYAKGEKNFIAFTNIANEETVIKSIEKQTIESKSGDTQFEGDLTSAIEAHGLTGWTIRFDIKRESEVIENDIEFELYTDGKYKFYGEGMDGYFHTFLNDNEYHHFTLRDIEFKVYEFTATNPTILKLYYRGVSYTIENFKIYKPAIYTDFSEIESTGRNYIGFYSGIVKPSNPDDYKWVYQPDFKPIEDRVRLAEANIQVNKTNITSKVSQTTYTADQTKINEQFSTITQDMKSWEAKFESIGGTNLLKGSKYVRGWLPINLETITETYANVVQEWDTIDATKVVTNAPDSVSSKKAYKRFEVPTLEEGRLYTFTMYVNNIRTVDEKITLEGGLVGEATIISGAKTRIVIQGYATSEKYIDVVLNSYSGGYFASAIVYKAMLELGNQVNDWTPNPDELESGSTRITEEGLTVGKSNSDVQTSIMDNGVFIQDTISGEPIAEYTRDGAKTNVLNATDIYSDSIIRRQKNSMDIYVGSTMTGDGSGRDSSNRLDNINRAIDVGLNYAYHLTDYATINIYLKGTINEIVMITGVSGYGNINIIGESGSRLVGAIFVNSCTAQVNIKDLNISLDAPNAVNACINYHNSTSGNILNCTLVGQDTGRGVNVTRSYVAIENAQFFDLSNGIIATDFGRVLATDCKGRTTFKYGSATKGGWLGAIGTRPSVPELPALLSTDTGVIDDTKMTTYSSGTRPSFAPPTFGTVSKTFYADLATANSNGYEWLEGEARQGTYNGKINIGIAKFGSKIKDWLAANGGYQGTVTAVITAKRNRSSGGGTVSFKITSPYTLTLPAVSRGGSSSATAGTSLTGSITTSSNLTLKTSTTSSSDYAGYTSVSIKITTMKKV